MKKQFPWFGLFLVVIGAVLLLNQLHVLRFGWARLIWIICIFFGGGIVLRGLVNQRVGSVFWGTVIFLTGIFFTLHQFEIIESHGRMIPAVTLVIFGFAFLMKIIFAPRTSWPSIIPAVVFLGLGSALMLSDLGYLYHYDVWMFCRTYWPVLLIAAGIAAVFKARGPRQS